MDRRLHKTFLTLAILLLALAACAPDNLDVTPSPTPTNTPEPTATRPPTATPNPDATATPAGFVEPTEEAAVDPLETIIAAWPAQWTAGVQWRRGQNEATGERVTYQDVEGGRTFTLYFTESGGSLSEITVGLFDSPEAAQTYYDTVADRVRTLENAEENATFPTPNRFGQGTYGQDALLLRDNMVVRVSVPRYSASSGTQPTVALMRNALRQIDAALGTTA